MSKVKTADIHKGAILWESSQYGSTQFKVKDEPVHKDGKWTWVGITNDGEQEYLITDGYEHYGPRITTEPEYFPAETLSPAPSSTDRPIDHNIDVRYESDVIEAFNKFIKKWVPKYYSHLIDSDDNDGEFMRRKIRGLFTEASKNSTSADIPPTLSAPQEGVLEGELRKQILAIAENWLSAKQIDELESLLNKALLAQLETLKNKRMTFLDESEDYVLVSEIDNLIQQYKEKS